MTARWKKAARAVLRRTGYDAIRYRPDTSFSAQRAALLRSYDVDVVLDVGANTGQFASALRDEGYRGRVVSFEPLRAAFDALAARADGDAQWDVRNLGLGAVSAVTKMNVAGNSQSSSILPMLERHLASAPESAYVGSEAVEIKRLDEIFDEAIGPASRPFLKLDVQGYEQQVLEGATSSMPRIVGLQLESSVVPLYEGEELFPDMLARTLSMGFALAAVMPNFTDVATGQLLSLDSIFFKPR